MSTAQLEPPRPPRAGQATFGELLRQYRLAAGLSQEALAERAGLSVQGLSLLENGKRQAPYRSTVALLARALGLSTDRGGHAGGGGGALPAACRRQASCHFPPCPPPRRQGPTCPLQLTSFIGREREMAEVAGLLASTRLLTLTGTGGVGKTRLALQVAAGLLDSYAQGVWLVELAPLADPALVPGAVLAALGVPEQPGRAAAGHPARRPAHRGSCCWCWTTASTCSTPAPGWSRRCCGPARACGSWPPAGSRWGWPARSAGGSPPSHCPSTDQRASPAVVAQCEAVQLFVERARAVQPQFALTAANAAAVAGICTRLDGIPLALELAAARLGGLGVAELAARLDQRFRLLTGGSRTALPRQQTLQATVDWSYDLLTPREQTLFTVSPSSPAGGAWRRRRRSVRAGPSRRRRCWTCWRGWWTSRWCWPRRPGRRQQALPAAGDAAAVWAERLRGWWRDGTGTAPARRLLPGAGRARRSGAHRPRATALARPPGARAR